MNEEANKKEEREFQKEMLKIQLLNDGINSFMTAFIALAISWLVLSVGIFFTTSVSSDVKMSFATSALEIFVAFLIACLGLGTVEFVFMPRYADKKLEPFLNPQATDKHDKKTLKKEDSEGSS